MNTEYILLLNKKHSNVELTVLNLTIQLVTQFIET